MPWRGATDKEISATVIFAIIIIISLHDPLNAFLSLASRYIIAIFRLFRVFLAFSAILLYNGYIGCAPRNLPRRSARGAFEKEK
jgi:hypothetical protein